MRFALDCIVHVFSHGNKQGSEKENSARERGTGICIFKNVNV